MDVLNSTPSATLPGQKTPFEIAFGITPDISALVQYAFHEPIYYHSTEASFPNTNEQPGRWLGVARNVGNALTYYVLTHNNTVIARSVLGSALDILNPNLRVLLPSNIMGDDVDSGNPPVVHVPHPEEQNVYKSQNIHLTWEDDIYDVDTGWQKVGSQSNRKEMIQSTVDIIGDKPAPTVDP